MQKEILQQLLSQSKMDCLRTLKEVNSSNVAFRLTEKTASAGFIYRHIGEATLLLAQFLGYPTTAEGSTFGQTDTGKAYDPGTSYMLFEQGYDTLEKLVQETPDDDWSEEIATTWFGKISRIRLLSITLSHNAHHCGQIASSIAKGRIFSS